MSSQAINRLISSLRKLNSVCLAYKSNNNGGYRILSVQPRQFSSKSKDEYYTSAGLHDAKYPEHEMNEILRRVSKLEGPGIERRRQLNFVRNGIFIVASIAIPIVIISRLAYIYLMAGTGFDPPVD